MRVDSKELQLVEMLVKDVKGLPIRMMMEMLGLNDLTGPGLLKEVGDVIQNQNTLRWILKEAMI